MAGPGLPGPKPYRPAASGRRVDVADAEDDDDAVRERYSGIDQPDDAVDDAGDVWVLHTELPERAGAVLDRLQHHRSGDTGIRHRLGTAAEIDSGNSSKRCDPGSRRRARGGGASNGRGDSDACRQ